MAKSKPASSQEFWSSDLALQTVREHLAPEWAAALGEPLEWSPLPDEEVWQALSREVRERAHRGHHQPGFKLMTTAFNDAKQEAGVYRQLRDRLVAFANLLRTWRQELVAAHGSDFWDRVLPGIHDPKEKVVVELLRQTSARTIDDAVNDLDRLGREGVTYQLAGQDPIRITPTDCGIDLFVEAARLFLRRLGAKDVDAGNGGSSHPNNRPRVLVYFRHQEVRLTRSIPATPTKPKGEFRECTLASGKCQALFLALLAVDGIVPRDVLYREHTHREEHRDGEPFGKRTQNRLSQVKRDLNALLTDKLGPYPGGADWVLTVADAGYKLNTAGITFQKHDERDAEHW